MENVILIIHLLLALGLIGVVLMQRSEGGGLGIGGGGGGSFSARSAGTALGKVTWVLAVSFIVTSLTLTVMAAQKSSGSSILDRLGGESAPAADTSAPADINVDSLLPPPSGDADAPLVPTAD
ncbi:MAG: preprotein translocase subunit SecG [Pelagimonas sp.]|jgi:preprotein translocase subunit SecG|nr:preprotein translocase subunit SecG [Pelagimonas sp.]